MDGVLAIIYAEKALIALRNDGKQITVENMEKELNKLLNIDKKIVLAYCKVALYNLLNSPNEINIRSLEMEFEMLQEHFTTDGIIETAKRIR